MTDYSLERVVRQAMVHKLAGVNTCIPARIEKYDVSQQKIDAQPLITSLFFDDDDQEIEEQYPVIPSIPVLFPRSARGFISFPIAVGDFVLLVFSQRALDKWLSGNGAETNPIDPRMFDLVDAVAIPGCYPYKKSLDDVHTDNVVLGFDGSTQVHVKDGELALGKENPADWVALAGLVRDETQKVIDYIKNTVVLTFNAHMHTSAAPGSPTTPPVTTITVPIGDCADVGSSVVSAE